MPTTDPQGVHFLLVGDSTDLPALRQIVSRLPVNAYGQIFVEIASVMQIQPWRIPEGMALTWLCRDRKYRAVGGLVPRGELVTRAVMAWVAEWMPTSGPTHRLPRVLWIGCSTCDEVDRLYRHLESEFDDLHLHHPHHD